MSFIVAYEQAPHGPRQEHAADKKTAEARATALMHQGVRRVTYFEVDDAEEGAA